jgi:hypothetical protein
MKRGNDSSCDRFFCQNKMEYVVYLTMDFHNETYTTCVYVCKYHLNHFIRYNEANEIYQIQQFTELKTGIHNQIPKQEQDQGEGAK